MISVKCLTKIAIILKSVTLPKFHKAFVNRKYRLMFSNKSAKKPGPTGPDAKLIHLIVDMKKRNPSYGYRRIAMQISNAFGIVINKDIGHMKDSLLPIDFVLTPFILKPTGLW